ncbi:MAG: hypothetical protein AAFQ66_10710 [Pseudomonadota bacterium]
MAPRDKLRDYKLYWFGPGGHESHRKMGGLNVLSMHIGQALRNANAVTSPTAHEIHIGFCIDPKPLELFARHRKTTWLHLVRNYRELEALSFSASNAEIGEFAIEIAKDLQAQIAASSGLIDGFPFAAMDQAIETFRSEGYAFTPRPSPMRPFDASPLKAKFFTTGNCLETKVAMAFFLGREELHRRDVATLAAGAFDTAKYLSSFDLYDSEIKLLSMDVARPSPIIRYADLPDEVRQHLPSNEQLHAAWGTPTPS